jgi:peptidoglycan hydrolase-like protein with peptidoglycan-binding domain
MQQALKIGADGIFGPGTERALKAWQRSNGLTADGIAGPATLARLFG